MTRRELLKGLFAGAALAVIPPVATKALEEDLWQYARIDQIPSKFYAWQLFFSLEDEKGNSWYYAGLINDKDDISDSYLHSMLNWKRHTEKENGIKLKLVKV